MMPRDPRRGAALLYAIGLMAVIGTLSATLWNATLRETAQVRQARHRAIVRQLADAGLDHAVALLTQGKSIPGGHPEFSLGEGFYSMDCRQMAPGTFEVTAIGRLREDTAVLAQQTTRAELRLDEGNHLMTLRILPENNP